MSSTAIKLGELLHDQSQQIAAHTCPCYVVYMLKTASKVYLRQKVCEVWKGHLHALADQILFVQALATGISMYPSQWRPASPALNYTF